MAKQTDAATAVQPRMLDIKAAALYLGTTVRFMRSLVWDRKLPKLKFGKKYVFDRQDLDKFIEQQKRAA